MSGPRVIQVIESRITRGVGTQANPFRAVMQYHTLDGELLAERDTLPPSENGDAKAGKMCERQGP